MGNPYDQFDAQPAGNPYDQFTPPNEAHGVWGSLAAGWQNSASGLAVRGRLPDVVLDPSHAKWYEKAMSGAASTVSDLPEMVAGGLGGGAAGAAAGPVGALLGAGAGAMAVPAAIRESLVQAYTKGEVADSADFLSRAAIVLRETGKAALVGAATAGTGGVAARTVGGAIAPAIGESIGIGTATKLIGGAQVAGEIGAMTVTPSVLEGKLPEPQDFLNAAIVVGGMKGAGHIAGKLSRIYATGGVAPEQVVADAHADPKIAEELKADTPITDTPAAYRPLEAAENAKQAIPEAANDAANPPTNGIDYRNDEGAAATVTAFMLHPFGEVPQQPGMPKVDLYPNFDYINTTDDVKAALARATELYGDKIANQTRGTVSWAQTEQEAAQRLSEMVGVKNPDMLSERTPGTGAGATEMYLRSQLMQAAVEHFTTLARSFDKLTSSPEDAIKLQAAAERVAMLSANFQGAASETGRALNAIKMMNAGLRQAQAIKDLMASAPGDMGQVADIMKQVGNPVGAAAVARKVAAPQELNNWQKWGQVYKAGLLSGTKTYIVKAIGDSVALASNVLDRVVASGIGMFHAGEKVTYDEALGYLSGMRQGVSDALKVAASTWTKDAQAQGEHNAWEGHTNVFGMKDGKPPAPGSMAAIANKAIAFPHRVMGAETEAARTLNESGEAHALAIRQAIGEKFTPGTDDFNARVAAIKANPSEEMQAAIKKAGDEGTFTGKLGKFGKMMGNISKDDIGQFVLPFSTVPANLVTWAVKRMPGVANMLGEVREDFAAGGARRDIAIARQVIGAGVVTAAYGAVKGGMLSGGGLAMTPQERQAKVDAGWQPYSIRIGDKWFSYNRFDPLARVASIAADAAEIHEHLEDDDKANLPAMVGAAFGNALISQTYLSSINGLLQALVNPVANGPKWYDNFIGSWVPAFLGQIASANDPYARRIDGTMDELQSKIPVMRNELLPKINGLTGEPLENRSHLDITPIDVTNISNDPVLTEAARLGVGVGNAPKNINLPAAHVKEVGKVQLTPEQQNLFSTTAGKLVHEVMGGIVGQTDWGSIPDVIKKQIYEKVISQAHRAGGAAALPGDARAALEEDIQAELQKRLQQ